MTRHLNLTPLRLVGVLSLTLIAGCSEHPTHEAPPTTVYFTDVTPVNASRSREFIGTLHAHVETDLGFRIGGKVARRAVEVGDRVKAGQLIAVLDPADYDLGVVVADAQVRQAKAQAQLDSSDEARFGRLTGDGSIATADHERQVYKSQASDARLDQARRELQVSRNLASYATLVAPFDGVVTGLHAEAGQVVAVGQPVISMARDGNREVVADLPEGMIGDMSALQAQALPWDGQGAAVALKLREVSPLASPQGRMFRVKFTGRQPDDRRLDAWPLGSTAQLVLRYPPKSAIVLPVSALVNAGPKTIVWSVDGAGARLTPLAVKVVASDAESVTVEGVPEHAHVVTVGAQKLDAAMKVRAVERKPDEAMKVARSAT